jgi:hypothetical protein
MASSINQIPALIPPVICDFGWVYGSAHQRLPESTYTIDTSLYPPGYALLGANVTLPSSTIVSSFTSLAALQAAFPAKGAIILDDYSTHHIVVKYTSLITISGTSSSGQQGFGGCTATSTATFVAGATWIYDIRDYVDEAPLNDLICFDATNYYGVLLPQTVAPSNVTVLSYRWDFGNGEVANGPQASTTYTYNIPPASVQVKLMVVDSIGRAFSCTHHIKFVDLESVWARVNTPVYITPS